MEFISIKAILIGFMVMRFLVVDGVFVSMLAMKILCSTIVSIQIQLLLVLDMDTDLQFTQIIFQEIVMDSL